MTNHNYSWADVDSNTVGAPRITREVWSWFQKDCGVSDRDHLKLRVDLLSQHAFDGHQRSGEGTGTAAARSLVTNLQSMIGEIENFEIASVTHQIWPDFLVQYLVNLQQARVIAGDRGDGATYGRRRAIERRESGLRGPAISHPSRQRRLFRR